MDSEARAPYGCKAQNYQGSGREFCSAAPPVSATPPGSRVRKLPGCHPAGALLPVFLLNRIQKSLDRLVAPGVFIRQARRSGLIQLHLLLRLLLLTEVLVDLSQVVVRLGQVRIHARASL